MDTAPVGHRFDHSALGLYDDEGHAMYNFAGLQQSGSTNQMRPVHQFESSPSAGYNPHSASFSEPGSRGHSIPPATPMIVAQMQKMNARLNDVESTQQSLVTNQQQLTKRVECNETMITELQERLGTMATVNTTKSVAGKKNISNMHPGLNPIFFNLCGIDVNEHDTNKKD
ncbi:hypothetical protein AZE42_13344 [Rhizopogon vesiculosus]|uniref:Uncharacterized protein n=1 Tax=Rhizopogon vesiculosus TaxID=180088 RepID=A0A1J8QPT3_9AGAM|nr:hypothetical protein AZE42_13344 [Rhizopogon vesiculosus]